jgi:hypothetical protein
LKGSLKLAKIILPVWAFLEGVGMLRFVISAAAAGFLVGHITGPAQASTYNLLLTQTSGTEEAGGSGTFSINGPAGTGTYTLASLNISIDGNKYTLNNELGSATATFSNGKFQSITYAGLVHGAFLTLGLPSSSTGYSYLDVPEGLGSLSFGTVTDPPGATPLPSTWTMMLIGLAGVSLLLYWGRRGSATSASAGPSAI